MRKSTAARNSMPLTTLEREVITDSMLKIQSVQASLEQIDGTKIPEIDEIHSCLRTAHRSFSAALRNGPSQQKQIKR
jgi:hypothetical protein